MRTAGWWWAATLLGAATGCGGATGPTRYIDWYGTYQVEDSLRLQVSTHGMSQIEYTLTDSQTGEVLFRDYSSDTTKWFFYWDERQRLWAHADNIGTAVWSASDGYHFRKHWLKKDSPLVNDVPQPVLDKLPDRTRQYLSH